VPFVLERILKVDYPWVFGFHEDFSFGLDVSHLVLEHHFTFFHLFHRHDFTCRLDFADSDLTKGTSSNNRERLEVSYSNLFSPRPNQKVSKRKTTYILRLSSASLCIMSCLISSFSFSLRLRCCILDSSMSQASLRSRSFVFSRLYRYSMYALAFSAFSFINFVMLLEPPFSSSATG
jgi:hypothetical protein